MRNTYDVPSALGEDVLLHVDGPVRTLVHELEDLEVDRTFPHQRLVPAVLVAT